MTGLAKLRASLVLFALLLLAGTAQAQMSEGERKAAARASYLEGVELQDKGKPNEALARFEAAQKLFDAPTHLLRIAECQAVTGKLVEAAETYETLARRTLPPGSPDVFVQAQETGKAEAAALRPRIPTLRVTVQPEPATLQNLQVTINEKQMPVELLGIGRPVNPGWYRVSVSATGYGMTAPVTLEVVEKENKTAAIVLQPGVTTPVVAPPPPGGAEAPPPPPPYEANKKQEETGPSASGLLFGLRPLLLFPGGNVRRGVKFSEYSGSGPGIGLDLMARFAKVLLAGGTLEFASLGAPDQGAIPTGVSADVGTQSVYLGALFGLLPNVDRVSFVGTVGLGFRFLSRSLTLRGATVGVQELDESYSGLNFGLDGGVSIPAGPVRIVPKVGLSGGEFTTRDCTPSPPSLGSTASAFSSAGCSGNNDGATHIIASLAVGLYWHLDLKKPAR